MQSNQNLPLSNLISIATENPALFEKTWSGLEPALLKSLVLSRDSKGNPVLSHYITHNLIDQIFEKLDPETQFDVLKMQNPKGDNLFSQLIQQNKNISKYPLTSEQWEFLILSTNNQNKNILDKLGRDNPKIIESLMYKLSPKKLGELIETNDVNFIKVFINVLRESVGAELLLKTYQHYWQPNNADLNPIWQRWPTLLNSILLNDVKVTTEILKKISVDIMLSMIESKELRSVFTYRYYYTDVLKEVFFTYPLKMLALDENWGDIISRDAGKISRFYRNQNYYNKVDPPKLDDYSIFQLLVPIDVSKIKEPRKWLDLLNQGLCQHNPDVYYSVLGRLLLAINPDNINEACKAWLKIKNIHSLSKEESLLISYKLNQYSAIEGLSPLQLMEIHYHIDEHTINIVNKVDAAEEKSPYPDFPREAFEKKKTVSKDNLIALAIDAYSELDVRLQNLKIDREQALINKFADLILTVPVNLKQQVINIFKNEIKTKEALVLISEFENVISTLESLGASNASLPIVKDVEWSSLRFLFKKDMKFFKNMLSNLDPDAVDKLIVQNDSPSLLRFVFINEKARYISYEIIDKLIANAKPEFLFAAFQIPDVIKSFVEDDFDSYLAHIFKKVVDPQQRLLMFQLLDQSLGKQTLSASKADLYFKFHPNINKFSSAELERLFLSRRSSTELFRSGKLLIEVLRSYDDYAFKMSLVKKLDKTAINTILKASDNIFSIILKGHDDVAQHIINVGDEELVVKHLKAMNEAKYLDGDKLMIALLRKNPQFYAGLLESTGYGWLGRKKEFYRVEIACWGFLSKNNDMAKYFHKAILSDDGLALFNKPDKYFNYAQWCPVLQDALRYANTTVNYEKVINVLCQLYFASGQTQLMPPLLLEIKDYKNIPKKVAATWSDILRMQSQDPKIPPLQRLTFTLKALDFLEASVEPAAEVKEGEVKDDNVRLDNDIDTLGNALLYGGFFGGVDLDEKADGFQARALDIGELQAQKSKFVQDFKKTMADEINQSLKKFEGYLQSRKAETRHYTGFMLGSSAGDYTIRENYFTALALANTVEKKLEIVNMALGDKKITGGRSHKVADILREMKQALEVMVEIEKIEGKVGVGLRK